jgi:hypothetical protein
MLAGSMCSGDIAVLAWVAKFEFQFDSRHPPYLICLLSFLMGIKPGTLSLKHSASASLTYYSKSLYCRSAPRGSETFQLAAALALAGWLEGGQHVKDTRNQGIHETRTSFANLNFGA